MSIRIRDCVVEAAVLVRRHVLGWFLLLIAVQGALVVVVLPVLAFAYRAFLSAAAIDGLNTTSLALLWSSPIEVLALVVFAVLAVVSVVAEVGFVSAFAAALWHGEPFTFGTGTRAARTVVKSLASPQAPLLALYVIVILPLSHLGIGSTLTQHIRIPGSVVDAATATPVGTIVYVAVIAAVVYGALRLLLTLAHLVDTPSSIVGSLRGSIRATRHHQGRLALLLGATAAGVVVVLVIVGAAGLAVVATVEASGVDSRPVSQVALTLLEVTQFFVVGFATIFLASALVAFRRATAAEALVHAGRTIRPRRATRVASVVLLSAAALATAGQATTAAAIGAAPVDTQGPVIVAHRGYAMNAVENSLDALSAAARAGADIVELDVQETKDGGFVIIHDTNLRRLAGINENVYDLTTDEATSVELHQNGHTSRIPTLEAFAAEAHRLGMPLLVDVKPHGHEAAGYTTRIAEELERLNPDHSWWVQSLDDDTLGGVRVADPNRTTAFVVGLQLGLLPTTDAHAIVIEDWSFSGAMLATAHLNGQEVYVWTIDDAPTMRAYLRRGVDGIITDDVPLAVAERAAHAASRPETHRYLETARDLVLG